MNPQNPYFSFLVAASAGCGKTFQLSQRFLALVAAGADPSHILTVTYTKKAVAEMRERIIQDAMKLALNPLEQKSFDQKIGSFYKDSISSCQAEDREPPPPRSARETAEVILASTQTIKISTIDSVFYEWSNKFGDELIGQPEHIPTPADMLGALEKKALDAHCEQAAYLKFLEQSNSATANESSIRQEDMPDQSFDAAIMQANSLDFHDTYVWACQKNSLENDVFASLLQHPTGENIPATAEACIAGVKPELTAIINLLSNPDSRDECLSALTALSPALLNTAGLLTKDWTVSKTKLKGKSRDSVAAEIATVEEQLVLFQNAKKIEKLNQLGKTVFEVRTLLKKARTAQKQKQRTAEFSDLTKVAYQLFASETAAGTRYLIQKSVRHLLLDEFQDTSRSQWFVFHAIAEELISGEGSVDSSPNLESSRSAALRGTVFLVGDEKQSIYGYREADPEVLEDAALQLCPLGLQLAPLNASYRSAQIALDFVNAVFSEQQAHMNAFPPHETAVKGSSHVVPNAGRIAILEPVLPNPDSPETDIDETESQLLAEHIRDVLSGRIPSPVWDKALRNGTGGFRKIKPGDCAILYRAKGKTHLIESALRSLNIPFIREEAQGFFERPEILDALTLISFLAKPSDLASLCGVLRSPMGCVTNSDLVKALSATIDLAMTADRPKALLTALERAGYKIAGILKAKLSEFNQAEYQSDFQYSHSIFRDIIRDCGALENYGAIFPAPDNDLAAANLTRFVEILVSLESRGHNTFAIQSKALKELATINETGTSNPASDAVRLMTVHKSKGLEFPFVALADTAKDWLGSERYWLRGNDSSGTPGIFYIGKAADRPKKDAQFDSIGLRLQELNHAEMRRLLYVALTRAKQYLFISGSTKKADSLGETYLGILTDSLKRMSEGDLGSKYRTSTQSNRSGTGESVHLLETADLRSLELEAEPEGIKKDDATAQSLFSMADNSIVPAEVRIKTPSSHELAKTLIPRVETTNEQAVAFNKEESRIYGLMVHAVLELAAVDNRQWQQLHWQAAKWKELAGALAINDSHRQAAVAEAQNVIASPAWQKLLAKAVVVLPEVPLAYLKGGDFIVGRADLVIQQSDHEMWVVDYKSSAVSSEEARDFAISQGFDLQVENYCKVLRAAYPKIPVKGALLFTGSATLIEL